jgi:hypothetical protein
MHPDAVVPDVVDEKLWATELEDEKVDAEVSGTCETGTGHDFWCHQGVFLGIGSQINLILIEDQDLYYAQSS